MNITDIARRIRTRSPRRLLQKKRSDQLASQIIVAIFRVLIPSSAVRVQGFAEIADIVFEQRQSSGGRDLFERKLKTAAKGLAYRLDEFERVEFPLLQENERNAAISVVHDSIGALNLSRAEVIVLSATPDALYKRLLRDVQSAWKRAELKPYAHEYGKIYLREASRFITVMVKELPEFTDEVALLNLEFSQKIFNLLESGAEDVAIPRSGTASDRATFENDYLRAVRNDNKTMELFGLDLPPELCRLPLDIAYLTMMAAPDHDRGTPPRPRRVDEAIGSLVRRAEKAKTAGARILLIGPAGSGKTTITQWLATQAARQGFEGPLAPLNETMPVIVRLRHLFAKAGHSPAPADLISAAPRGGVDPGTWVEHRLREGALLVLDGVDELSEAGMSSFLDWFEACQAQNPKTTFVVTSRPEGLYTNFFEALGFSALRLLPMGLDDIIRCADSWFDALISLTRPAKREFYRVKQRSLQETLKQKPAVQELASTPLLCAMLCAYYADDLDVTLPRTRGELYERVISALIDKRERARRSIHEAETFSLQDKLLLLQAVARHLTENSATSLLERSSLGFRTRDDGDRDFPVLDSALTTVEARMRGMPFLSLTPWDALRVLLDRSVVLRRVGAGEVEFSHRSFQEYLTGRDYADSRSLELLTARLHLPDWQRIMVYAARVLDVESASDLVEAILDEAVARPEARRELHLLVAECVDSAGRLTDGVADRARQAVESILPPRSVAEARLVALSSLGDSVLPWLANRYDAPDETIMACVRAAALIGGAEALSLIAGYAARTRSPRVTEEILENWSRFDAPTYFRHVVRTLPWESLTLPVRSKVTASFVAQLTEVRRIRVETREWIDDLRGWHALRRLEELDFSGHRTLRSLAGVEELPALRRLNLSGNTGLEEFSRLADVPALRWLCLDGCSRLNDIAFVSRLPELSVFYARNCNGLRDFSPLAEATALRTVVISGKSIENLDFCARLPLLQTLRVRGAQNVGDTKPLAACTSLRRLEIRYATASGSPFALANPALRILKITGMFRREDIASLGRLPNLQDLELPAIRYERDLTALPALVRLRRLRLVDWTELTAATGIAGMPALQKLDLGGSALERLDGLDGLAHLSEVRLDECHRLTDISVLAGLSSLRSVSLLGVPALDPGQVDALRRKRPDVRVDHDAYSNTDQGSS